MKEQSESDDDRTVIAGRCTKARAESLSRFIPTTMLQDDQLKFPSRDLGTYEVVRAIFLIIMLARLFTLQSCH